MNPWWKRPEPRTRGEGDTSRSRKGKGDRSQGDEAASVRSIDVLAEAEELAAREKPERGRRPKKSAQPKREQETEERSADRGSKPDSGQPKRRVRRRRRTGRRDGDTDRAERTPARKKESAPREKTPDRRPESKMALYLDVESLVAADETFDAARILEHLRDRGKVLIQRCYADWRRHADLKEVLHAASMELIDVPVHGGNRTGAEMKMVVDALEACYQRDGIDTFILVSGRRELLPLVAKLREADRRIVGIGSRDSSSELVDSCDVFLYLEDLFGEDDSADPETSGKESGRRRGTRSAEDAKPSDSKSAPSRRDDDSDRQRREASKKQPRERTAPRPSSPGPDRGQPPPQAPESLEDSILQAVQTVEREGHERLWSSLVQQALRRWDPELNERRLGYDGFTDLLEDAERNGLLELARDERTGLHYVTNWRGRSD